MTLKIRKKARVSCKQSSHKQVVALKWINQDVKEILLPSQINFILHHNSKIICQRNKIPVSLRITFQRKYANLLTHFHRVPIAAKFFFFQTLTKILFLVKRCIFYNNP